MTSLSFSLYYPLLVLGLGWGLLTVAGRVVAGRGSGETGANLETLGFGALLVGAAWAVVLLVISLINYPIRLSDMALTALTVFAFFALLIILLFVLTEVRIGRRRVGSYVGVLALLALVVLVVVPALS